MNNRIFKILGEISQQLSPLAQILNNSDLNEVFKKQLEISKNLNDTFAPIIKQQMELSNIMQQNKFLINLPKIDKSILENIKTAYKNGCDEYIKKPFYLEELEIKIDKICKVNSDQNVIKISENIFYDMGLEELFIDDKIKRLRKKEKRLLTILLKNLNKTVSTQTLEDYVWENDIKESYHLRQLVNALRKYFGKEERFIFSEAGVGYRLEIKKVAK